MSDCLDEDTAVALVQGDLATRRAAQVHAHVEDCEACRQLVGALARMPTIRRSAPAQRESNDDLAASRIADRYELGGVLGAGAMGIVYQARDVKLARTVALKRVRGRTADAAGAPDSPDTPDTQDAHERLVREALAMAQLSHPSVVSVFDAGLADGAAFVAMEYVDGDTLRGWLAKSSRSWRAIAELFVQMARGLQAAHAANLVHGDFKPDNVLVDASGRARIADFGLARTIGEVSHSLTGTPAYMAPEQLDGGAASAASDQYAWATSLYEALHRKRPYGGRTVSELRAEQLRGLPRRGRVPGALSRIVERGLATDPAARFPSMAVAASALAALPGRRARSVFAVALGGAAIVSGAVAWTAKGDAAAPDCRDGAEQLTEVWSPERAARIKAAFVAAGVASTGEAVVSTLDTYGERWRTQRKAACEATRSGEQSSSLLDHQIHCLDLRRASLREVIGLVEGLAGSELGRAMPTVLGLPALQACADRGAMLAEPELPSSADARAELLALEAELHRADAEANASRFDAARTRYDRVVAGATRIAWSPLVAEAWMSIGQLELKRGHTSLGDDALSNAIDAASRAHDDRLIADTLIKMLAAVMFTTVQSSEAERMIKLADAAVTRAGDDPLQRAELHYAAGMMLYLRHDRARGAKHYEQALAIWDSLPGDHRDSITRVRIARAAELITDTHFAEAMTELDKARAVMGEPVEQSPNADNFFNISCMARMFIGQFDQAHGDCVKALEIFSRRFGPDHPDTAAAEGNLASILLRQGHGPEALKHQEHSFAATLAAFGADHPQTISARKNLADTLGQLGQHERARDHLNEMLAALERTLGKDHPKVAEALTLLAGQELATGDHQGAIKRLEQALPLLEKAYGRTHDMTVTAINSLAMAYQATGRGAEAIATFQRARKLLVERAGPDDLNVGLITYNLAEIDRTAGRFVEALAGYDETERIFRKGLPPTHALFGHVLTARGEALLTLRRSREAIDALDRAMPIRLTGGDEAATAQTELALAEALLQSGGDRKRARGLVASATKRLDAAGQAGTQWRVRADRLRKLAG